MHEWKGLWGIIRGKDPRKPAVRFWRQKEERKRHPGKGGMSLPADYGVTALGFPSSSESGKTHWCDPLGRGQARQTSWPMWLIDPSLRAWRWQSGNCPPPSTSGAAPKNLLLLDFKEEQIWYPRKGFGGQGLAPHLVLMAAPHIKVFLRKEGRVGFDVIIVE